MGALSWSHPLPWVLAAGSWEGFFSMAASSLSACSKGLRRVLTGAPAPWQSRLLPSRSCSSSSLFNDGGDGDGGNVPPLTTPKLFVSGLSRLTTDEKLREAFSPFGQLLEAKVITDKVSGRSKGFGFVRYTSIEEASKAREGMNAKFLDGWVIFVDPAKPRQPRPPPPPPEQRSETGFRTNKTIGWCG